MKIVASILVGIAVTARADIIGGTPVEIFSGSGMFASEYQDRIFFFFSYPYGNGVASVNVSFPGGELSYGGRIERGIPGRTAIYATFTYDWDGIPISASYFATENFGPDERGLSASPSPESFFIEPDGLSFGVQWHRSQPSVPAVPDDGSTPAMLGIGVAGVALRQRIFR